MQRRQKGQKRYTGRRERAYTEPLVLEGEYERARLAAERITSRTRGAYHNDNVMKSKGKLTEYE